MMFPHTWNVMPFLDFIRNRRSSQQQPVASKPPEQKPETASQYYARQAAEDQAKLKPTDQLPADARADLESVRAIRDKVVWPQATQPLPKAVSAADAVPNPEPMRQNREGQDRSTPH
jgi:hypothetical protein